MCAITFENQNGGQELNALHKKGKFPDRVKYEDGYVGEGPLHPT